MDDMERGAVLPAISRAYINAGVGGFAEVGGDRDVLERDHRTSVSNK
jgi:hypothetical protein